MNVRESVGRWLVRAGQLIGFGRVAGVVEHTGTIDTDDHLWQRVGESPDPNNLLTDIQQTRQRRLSRVHYFRHAIGGALPDMQVARVIGAGPTWTATDPEVQKVIDRFSKDPDNNLEENLPRSATEFLLFGELFLPIALTPTNADVRLGYLLPDEIERVIWRVGDAKKPIAFLQRRPRPGEPKRLWVIPHPESSPDEKRDNWFPPHPALTDEDEPASVRGEDGLPVILPNVGGGILPEIEELLAGGPADTIVAGYAFYHRTGCLMSGRGRSLFERINTWLKSFDDWFMNTLRHALHQAHFLYHLKISGAQPDEITALQERYKQPPRAGAMMITDDRYTLEPLSPQIAPASAVRELFTGLIKIIGVATGFPGHEVGAEDDTNRATAGESRSVSINRAKRFQREIACMVLTWFTYQIQQKIYRKMLPETVDQTVEAGLPELDARDEKEVSASVADRVTAMVPAVERGLVLEEDARAFIYEAMGRELPDLDEFARKLQEERRKRDEMLGAEPSPALLSLVDTVIRGRQQQAGGPGGQNGGQNGSRPAGVGRGREDLDPLEELGV